MSLAWAEAVLACLDADDTLVNTDDWYEALALVLAERSPA